MKNDQKHATLFVELRDKEAGPTIVEIPNAQAPKEYRKLTSAGIDFFYDWLRAANGEILGICLSPSSDDAEKAVRELPERPYSQRLPNGAVEFYFGESREFVLDLSGDQAFGGSDIYLSDAGAWMFSFDLYSLTPEELLSIRKLLPKR